MASYQVPQFLDSGDKILGPLNLRQFGYALFGFLICVIIFTIVSRILPGLGIYAFVPAIPVGLFAAYLALGKYNGRDSDVYAYKLLLFLLKPRFMAYHRLPYTDDLDAKVNDFTVQKIELRWKEEAIKKLPGAKNELREFYSEESEEKAERIRRLGLSMDDNVTNTLARVQEQELKIQAKEALLNNLNPRSSYAKNPNLPGSLAPVLPNNLPPEQSANFFKVEPEQNL